VVQKPLMTTCIDLCNGAGISELVRFLEHFREYKIIVYSGLNSDKIISEGQVDSTKSLNVLYDDVKLYYHVITDLTGAVARRYVCKECNKSCRRDVTHDCEQTCSACMAGPPCAFESVRIPCLECNRHFRRHTCLANHKQSSKQKVYVRERKKCCATCGWVGRAKITSVTSGIAITVIRIKK